MRRLSKEVLLVAVAVLLLGVPAVSAQDQPEGSAQEERRPMTVAEPVMVTASRTTQDLFDLPMTVNVLTAEELQQNPKTDLGEILSDIPGVEVDAPGGPGTGRVSIRGEHAGRTLLLIDGVRMTNQASSASVTTFLMADASNIERIEVIKGPASVLYGFEAIGFLCAPGSCLFAEPGRILGEHSGMPEIFRPYPSPGGFCSRLYTSHRQRFF